jgi:hypothetical protein
MANNTPSLERRQVIKVGDECHELSLALAMIHRPREKSSAHDVMGTKITKSIIFLKLE